LRQTGTLQEQTWRVYIPASGKAFRIICSSCDSAFDAQETLESLRMIRSFYEARDCRRTTSTSTFQEEGTSHCNNYGRSSSIGGEDRAPFSSEVLMAKCLLCHIFQRVPSLFNQSNPLSINFLFHCSTSISQRKVPFPYVLGSSLSLVWMVPTYTA